VVGDLLQELFLRLWNSKAFDRAEDPCAYTYRTAINLAFEWRRGRQVCQTLQEDCPEAVNDLSALGKIIQAEELEQVLNATAKLPDLARDVVVMRYIEQDSYEHIAEQMGRNPHQVRALCSKGLGRIRNLLGGTKGGGNVEH